MENYRSGRSKRLAKTESNVPSFGVSEYRDRRSGRSRQAKPPLIEIELTGQKLNYSPGDFLMCEYRLRGIEGLEISALEASVIWVTEGKGSEDIGVHFFQRLAKDALSESALASTRRLSTVLPCSPLSYSGEIVKVRWSVRIRLFYGEAQEIRRDLDFQLGDAAIPKLIESAEDPSHE